MLKNKTTGRWSLIGTLFGSGYICQTDQVEKVNGLEHGVWNKVSAHMDWVRKEMKTLGEPVCLNENYVT